MYNKYNFTEDEFHAFMHAQTEEMLKYKYIESEKAGSDIGFDYAKEDWLKRFSKAWMGYHMPDKVLKDPKASRNNGSKAKKPATRKRRSAKSYLK